MEDRLWGIALDLFQELCNALGFGAECLRRYTGMAQVRSIEIHVIELFASQRVWNQKWVPNQAIDPPFLRYYPVSLRVELELVYKATDLGCRRCRGLSCHCPQ